jgi:hypothetical protein
VKAKIRRAIFRISAASANCGRDQQNSRPKSLWGEGAFGREMSDRTGLVRLTEYVSETLAEKSKICPGLINCPTLFERNILPPEKMVSMKNAVY